MNSKTAFVTGAAGYIGLQTALTLAKEGTQIAVCDINESAVLSAVDKIRAAGGLAKGYPADVSDPQAIEGAISRASEDFGSLDILIHIAGGSARIAGGTYVPLVEQTDEVIDKVLKVNLYGAIFASRAAARIMIKQGTGGKIIHFASAVGINGLANCSEYAAAKGGIMSLTRSLAKELGVYKINVNVVAPRHRHAPRRGQRHRPRHKNQFPRRKMHRGGYCQPRRLPRLRQGTLYHGANLSVRRRQDPLHERYGLTKKFEFPK